MDIEIVYTVKAKSIRDVEDNLESYLAIAESEYGQPEIRLKRLKTKYI